MMRRSVLVVVVVVVVVVEVVVIVIVLLVVSTTHLLIDHFGNYCLLVFATLIRSQNALGVSLNDVILAATASAFSEMAGE